MTKKEPSPGCRVPSPQNWCDFHKLSPSTPSATSVESFAPGSKVVRRAVTGEKTATAVLDPKSDMRDFSAIVPG